MDDEPADSPNVLGQMNHAAALQAAAPQDEQPSANLAKGQTDAIQKITNKFEEEVFLAAMLPEKAQEAHARTLSEEDVHTFVNDIVHAAGNHHGKLGELLKLSKLNPSDGGEAFVFWGLCRPPKYWVR